MSANRSDFTDLLRGLGVDPSLAGLPLAGGLQATVDIGQAFYPRNLFGHHASIGPVAAQRGTVELLTQVPTLVWAYQMDPAANDCRIYCFPAQAASSGLTAVTPGSLVARVADTTQRNTLFSGTTLAFPTFPWPTQDAAGLENAVRVQPLAPFPVPANHRFGLQADTVNIGTDYWFLWEEALVR